MQNKKGKLEQLIYAELTKNKWSDGESSPERRPVSIYHIIQYLDKDEGTITDCLQHINEAKKDFQSCVRNKSTREEALGTAWKHIYFTNSYEVMYFDLVDKIKKWLGDST